MNRGYYRTLYASYIGYITQAIVNNLAPLLFVIFQRQYDLSVGKIGFLVSFNFGVQILTDLVAAKYAEKIGYKTCIVAAHIFSALGLVGLSILPELLPDPYLGLLAAITVYAVGGGIIEVLVSPIVEALPMDSKSAAMSLLHSFYCWGHTLVVLLSTLFFGLAGEENWRILPILWAVIPAVNIFVFASAPIRVLNEESESVPAKGFLKTGLFWLFFLLMICSGASEQAMSQWASYFAERGLRVSKALGDLLGPCLFAMLMGLSRLFYGVKGSRIRLERFMLASGLLCIASYLAAVFSPVPAVSLVACGICGLSVGIMWPGVFSLAAARGPRGGTAMFALLALAGDLGCAGGPALVGAVSSLAGEELKAGLMAAVLFPSFLLLGMGLLGRKKLL